MKLKHVYIFNAIVALVYGIGCVLIPKTMLGWHGLTQGSTEALMGQYFGLSIIGIGLVTWLIRNLTVAHTNDAITLGLLVSHAIGFVVSLYAVLNGMMGALGWLPVGIYLLLVLGYGYFRFLK